jgi:ABC-type nitrate/sulfonate/bicarbonate transport system substrate-binding protein
VVLRKFLLHPIRLLIVLTFVLAAVAAGCGGDEEQPAAEPAPATTEAAPTTEEAPATTEEAPATTEEAPPTTEAVEPAKVRLALDWTPNTNHTGFHVAQEMGFYDAADIEFEIIPYSNASTDTLVGSGKAECGVNFEDFMSIAVVAGTPEKSVMAILQASPTGLIVTADSPVESPKDLDGTTYGGFGLPGEQQIIETVIKNDGGQGDVEFAVLSTAAYEAVYNGDVDFSWAFMTWEVIEANTRGIELKTFPIQDYGIPRYYGVLMACNTDWLEQNPDVAKRFVGATVQGWQWTQENPDESAQILMDANPGVFTNEELVFQSNNLIAEQYLLDPNGQFGCQADEVWTAGLPTFLFEQGIFTDAEGNAVTEAPDFASFYTNEYMPYDCG